MKKFLFALLVLPLGVMAQYRSTDSTLQKQLTLHSDGSLAYKKYTNPNKARVLTIIPLYNLQNDKESDKDTSFNKQTNQALHIGYGYQYSLSKNTRFEPYLNW